MSKPVTQYIDAAQIEEMLLAAGFSLTAQAGFVKVQVPGAPAHAPKLYVARSKRVGRIDLSGFTVELEGVVTLDADLAFGNVKQQIDFTRAPADTLETLSNVLVALAEAPVPERAPRKAPKAKASEAKGWTTITTPAAKESRKEAIAEAAKKMGKAKGKKAKAEPEVQADEALPEEASNETPAEAMPEALTVLS